MSRALLGMQDRQLHLKTSTRSATCNQLLPERESPGRGHHTTTNVRCSNVSASGRPVMSTTSRARQGGGGGVGVRQQFPVGRRRYVPVVDGGCGCRPRRPRLLSGLPSFLKPSGCRLGGGKAVVRRSGDGEQYSSSSTSTASFSSSSCAATHSTGYSSSAYSSSDYYSYGGAAATKQQQQQPAALHKTKELTTSKKQAKTQKKKRHDDSRQMAEEEEDGVGVAVEKESSDPRADFRDSMVQMVVEMGLCDWDGLRCMLRRLLALNAPRHHAAILTAFAEVCAQIIAAPAAAASSSSPMQPSPSPPVYSQLYRR